MFGLERRREVVETQTVVDEIVASWHAACSGAGLVRNVQTVSGLTEVTPRVSLVVLGPPVRLSVELPAGLLADDIRAAAPRIAPHLGVAGLRVEPRGHGEWAVVTLLDHDPVGDTYCLPPGPLTGPVLLGRDEHGEDVTADPLDLGHIVVQGATGSGKSVWLYSLLTQLAEFARAGYPIEISGIDPSGISLRPFTASSVLGLTDPFEVEAYLAKKVELMDSRIREIPDDADILPVDSQHSVQVIVMEELPGLWRWLDAIDSKAAKRCRALLARLLAESRKARCTVILVAQRAEASIIGGFERGQCATRLSFAVDNLDAVRLLHPDATAEIAGRHATERPGIALLSGPGRALTRMRAPYIAYAEYVRRVR